MTLQNLLRIGRLKEHQPHAAEVRRLLEAIGRNLRDAAVPGISNETRFDVAYKAVMQCALVAMLAAGYRPAANEPGHHQTMIQSLSLTLGVDNDTWIVLDALRRQRNANDCTGQPITPAAVKECVARAKALHEALLSHLRAKHASLLEGPG